MAKAFLNKDEAISFYNKKDIVGYYIDKFGYYESLQLECAKKLIEESFLKFNPTCYIDIGANIGNHTIFFAKYFANIICLEPNPIARGILEANIFHHDDTFSKTTVYPYALSDKNGHFTFYQRLPSLNNENTNIGNSGLEIDYIGADYHEMNVETKIGDDFLKPMLDEYMVGGGVFMKIDTEGHEGHVIKSLIRTIEKVKPILWVEIGSSEIFNDIKKLFLNLGYESYGIKTKGSSNKLLRFLSGNQFEFISITELNSKTYADVFFIPSEIINR